MGLLVCAVHFELVEDFLEADTLAVAHGDDIVDAEDDVDGVVLYGFWVRGGVQRLMPSLQTPTRTL